MGAGVTKPRTKPISSLSTLEQVDGMLSGKLATDFSAYDVATLQLSPQTKEDDWDRLLLLSGNCLYELCVPSVEELCAFAAKGTQPLLSLNQRARFRENEW